jgi:hypothetical protein
MGAGALAAANRKSNEPYDKKDGCRDPQKMHGEASTKQDQDKQQCKNKYHEYLL